MGTHHHPDMATDSTTPKGDGNGMATSHSKISPPPKDSLDTITPPPMASDADPSADFTGDVDTNNTIPTLNDLRRVENLTVLDEDGKARPFKSLYSGPNIARRVLVIFVRHFFCGVCFPSNTPLCGHPTVFESARVNGSLELPRIPPHSHSLHNA